MNLGNSPNTPGEPGAPRSTARREPRFSFTATAALVDPSTEMKFSGRVSEISRRGCYVDILNPLPVGTLLKLQILRDQGTFEAQGKIIYVHEGFGMGVFFIDPPEDQLKILDTWLAELPPVPAR